MSYQIHTNQIHINMMLSVFAVAIALSFSTSAFAVDADAALSLARQNGCLNAMPWTSTRTAMNEEHKIINVERTLPGKPTSLSGYSCCRAGSGLKPIDVLTKTDFVYLEA